MPSNTLQSAALRWPPPDSLVFHCPCCGYRLATKLTGSTRERWQKRQSIYDDSSAYVGFDYCPVDIEHRIVRCNLCDGEFGLRISSTGRAYGELPGENGVPSRSFSYLAADLDRGMWLTGELYRRVNPQRAHPWVNLDVGSDGR